MASLICFSLVCWNLHHDLHPACLMARVGSIRDVQISTFEPPLTIVEKSIGPGFLQH